MIFVKVSLNVLIPTHLLPPPPPPPPPKKSKNSLPGWIPACRARACRRCSCSRCRWPEGLRCRQTRPDRDPWKPETIAQFSALQHYLET